MSIKETNHTADTIIIRPLGGDLWQVHQSVYDADDGVCYEDHLGTLESGITDPDQDDAVADQVRSSYGDYPVAVEA